MKNLKLFAVIIILLSSLSISSCDGLMTGDFKSFDSRLWGTWVSYDTITIDGYAEDWTSLVAMTVDAPSEIFQRGTS